MFLHIYPHNGVPIYDQIARQVKFAVADGALKAGEAVPSVRELARELAVNPNTVARAYRTLQEDQVLLPLRGTGMMVRQDAEPRCREERLELVRERLRQALREALESRLDPQELRTLVMAELEQLREEATK